MIIIVDTHLHQNATCRQRVSTLLSVCEGTIAFVKVFTRTCAAHELRRIQRPAPGPYTKPSEPHSAQAVWGKKLSRTDLRLALHRKTQGK